MFVKRSSRFHWHASYFIDEPLERFMLLCILKVAFNITTFPSFNYILYFSPSFFLISFLLFSREWISFHELKGKSQNCRLYFVSVWDMSSCEQASAGDQVSHTGHRVAQLTCNHCLCVDECLFLNKISPLLYPTQIFFQSFQNCLFFMN